MNTAMKKLMAFLHELVKDLGLKFLNGLLLGFLAICIMWFLGFTLKMSYVMFMKGWDFI
jgi:hypothetical protein